MLNGIVCFDKIQIKEVTSHLRNGWLFLVVHPVIREDRKSQHLKGFGANLNLTSWDIKKIKPLVVDKVVVKAKKTKEKDEGNT